MVDIAAQMPLCPGLREACLPSCSGRTLSRHRVLQACGSHICTPVMPDREQRYLRVLLLKTVR